MRSEPTSKHILAPTLRCGDVLALANLRAHKVAGIREAVSGRRAQIFYLPPYSPEMNPRHSQSSRPC